MSIVVAVTKNGRTVVAADSLCCAGRHREDTRNRKGAKVRRYGSVLIGSTGWSLYDNILDDYLDHHQPEGGFENEKSIFRFFVELWKALHTEYSFVNDQCNDQDDPFGDLDASFMIVNRTGIFGVAFNMDVSHFRQYHAIGGGREYAFGALDILYESETSPDEIARRAVGAATHFDLYCGGEIELFEL